MTDHAEVMRIAEGLDAVPETGADPALIQEAADALRRQSAEIERLRDELEALHKQEPVAEVTAIDEYGPCFGWRAHWIDAVKVGSKIYTHPQPAPSVPGRATMIERLKAAVEGECDGLAVDDRHAEAILDYVLAAAPEAPKENSND